MTLVADPLSALHVTAGFQPLKAGGGVGLVTMGGVDILALGVGDDDLAGVLVEVIDGRDGAMGGVDGAMTDGPGSGDPLLLFPE